MANTTRRQFISKAAALAALFPLTGLSRIEVAETPCFPGKQDEEFVTIPVSMLEPIPDAPPAFGPAERTATIDRWRNELDQAIVALESLWGFLGEARALPADQVNGFRFFDLEEEAFKRLNGLASALEMAAFEDLIEALTGKPSYDLIIKREIVSGEGKLERHQAEIEAIRRYAPTRADELQAFLEANWQG